MKLFVTALVYTCLYCTAKPSGILRKQERLICQFSLRALPWNAFPMLTGTKAPEKWSICSFFSRYYSLGAVTSAPSYRMLPGDLWSSDANGSQLHSEHSTHPSLPLFPRKLPCPLAVKINCNVKNPNWVKYVLMSLNFKEVLGTSSIRIHLDLFLNKSFETKMFCK